MKTNCLSLFWLAPQLATAAMAGCHLHGALQDTDSLEDALFLLGAHLFSDKWRMTNCLYQLSDLSHYDSRHRLSCFKNVQIIRTGIEELDTVICFLRSSSSIVQLSRICTPKTWTHKRRSVASNIRTTWSKNTFWCRSIGWDLHSRREIVDEDIARSTDLHSRYARRIPALLPPHSVKITS